MTAAEKIYLWLEAYKHEKSGDLPYAQEIEHQLIKAIEQDDSVEREHYSHIKQEDVRVISFTPNNNGFFRFIHEPTGLASESEHRSHFTSRIIGMNRLNRKVALLNHFKSLKNGDVKYDDVPGLI